ncbi:Hsp20/alpha crystallin family protein [Halostella litorea]|uniref:Hsp20/alpha crystallin family protein n=1 Tax=Halostella litorea TaxID=2528831 RepID=UPI0010925845|nr:Hsp20/alpha crystallin family protein [Halostella litorea]
MRRDDRDEPFDDIFREIERMMNEMMGADGTDMRFEGSAGFGADTHVDIHETDEEVRVVADLPGVEKADIELQCDGQVLTVSAASDRREYDERVSLPVRVDEHSASATYNNGVLEVIFERADGGSADIDVS